MSHLAIPKVCIYCGRSEIQPGRWALVKWPVGVLFSHKTCPACLERVQSYVRLKPPRLAEQDPLWPYCGG